MRKIILALPLILLTACDKPAATTPPTPTPAKSTAPTPAPAPKPAAPQPQPVTPPEPSVKSYTGVLLGDIMAGGGETTGWMLNQLDDQGNVLQATDVDVEKVKDTAEQLKGSKVRITGAVIEKDWPERGKTKIIVAEKIEEVP